MKAMGLQFQEFARKVDGATSVNPKYPQPTALTKQLKDKTIGGGVPDSSISLLPMPAHTCAYLRMPLLPRLAQGNLCDLCDLWFVGRCFFNHRLHRSHRERQKRIPWPQRELPQKHGFPIADHTTAPTRGAIVKSKTKKRGNSSPPKTFRMPDSPEIRWRKPPFSRTMSAHAARNRLGRSAERRAIRGRAHIGRQGQHQRRNET